MKEMVRLQGITKKFGNNVIIPSLDLTIYDGEFITLLGPSGCGKTTLLRMIAGLETPTEGSIYLDDENVTALPPYKRDVNMVFQHYALFPHMTVEENIKFGLMMKKVPADEQKERVAQVLYLTQLEEFRNRRPQQMSGKIFITNAGYANVFVIFAITGVTTDKRGRKKKEISAFIVERTDPGFSVGKHEKKMGIKGSSTCELIMEDCIIPKDRLLGKQGKGFGIAMKTLDGGRIGIASQALGLAEGAIEETIKYTKERVQFGRRISQFQNTQFQLADMHAKTEAAKWLVYSAAMKKENHEPYTVDAAMAKLVAAETASDVTRRCVQLFGGYGYTREYPMERMMRDAKITEIYEGTSEVQRMVISANLGVN